MEYNQSFKETQEAPSEKNKQKNIKVRMFFFFFFFFLQLPVSLHKKIKN